MSTILPRTYAPFGHREPGGHKYRAKRTTVDGITFDSRHEAEVYCELVLRQKAGELTFRRQVPYELAPPERENGKTIRRAITYVADFVVTFADGRSEVWDAKGHPTPAFKVKKRWVQQAHGIRIREV